MIRSSLKPTSNSWAGFLLPKINIDYKNQSFLSSGKVLLSSRFSKTTELGPI